MKRRIMLYMLTILLIVSGTMSVQAADSADTQRTIRVGFFQYDGYHEQDENGVRSGYGYELLQQMARYTNWTYEYVGYDKSWAEMLQLLEAGEIDLLTTGYREADAEERFGISSLPVGTNATLLTVRAGDTRYREHDYATYQGFRVGMQKDSRRNQSFAAFAEEHDIFYTAVYFDTMTEMADALQEGSLIDAVVTNSMRSKVNEWVLEQFDISEFYVLTRKEDTELLAEVNTAIAQMDALKYGWRAELNNRYFAATADSDILFTAEEREYLQQLQDTSAVIRVAMNPDMAPYSYFSNGIAKGILPEIFCEIAARTGIIYEIIETADREEYNELLTSGRIDIDLSACMGYNWAERQGYKLTDSYLSTMITRVSKKDISTHDNSNQLEKTAFLHHSGIRELDMGMLLANQEIIYYGSVTECLEAVKSGTADATYLYSYTAQQAVMEDVKNELTLLQIPEYTVDFAIGVRASAGFRLISILNKGVQSVKHTVVPRIILSETGTISSRFSLLNYLYDEPLTALIGVFVILILIFTIILLLVRAKSNSKLKAQAEELERFMEYVCASYDVVMEVNLVTQTCRRLFLKDGKVESIEEPYYFVNYENYQNALHSEDFEQLTSYLSSERLETLIEEGGGEYFECRSREADGQMYWHSYTLRAIPHDKLHPQNFILFRKNIHDAKEQEEMKKQALTDALETARQASEAKGTFLSRMSHEIRTSLNAVIGYMSIARNSADQPEKMLHCVENSELAARHLLDIINDVLDISSIESGKMKIAREEFDLRQQITTVSTIFFNQAKAKGILFDTTIQNLTEEWVVGDKLRINQILMNLLSNAVKFTPKGGRICLNISQIKLEKNHVHIKFEVSDSGIGMSEEYRQRLFKPFEQESAVTAQKYGGSGLGLSITKNLINMMGGAIDVQSEQGKGTTFAVNLRFGCSQRNEKKQMEVQDFSKLRALIVDHEKNSCDSVKMLLKRCGIKSDCVMDGGSALQQIRRRKDSEYSYDLCLLDWNLPGLDSRETVQKIREECGSERPVIIAAAYDTTELLDQAAAIGIQKVIPKPLFQSTLFDLLVSIYGKYQPKEAEEIKELDLKGMHLLLAEDNLMNQEIAVDILEKVGIVVDTAMNGQEACDRFLSAEPGTYQVILMDIQMPLLDGYQATKKIRTSRHEEAASIPIIAMTANAFTEDVAAALACGMNDHISKPIDYTKLFQALTKIIGTNEK